jgi:hypothetical protein
MALRIRDRRIIVTEAEDETVGWTPGSYGTTNTDVAEQANAVAESIAIGDAASYFTLAAGSVDLSNTLVYVYTFNNALQNPWDNTIPPQALLLGDGTNRIAFHMAGGNRRVFNHLEGPTAWQNLVLDGSQAANMDSAGNSYADAGSFASLDLTTITNFGNYFETLSKALGGGYNVATDIIRYGNLGLYVVGGTINDRGTFSELASSDRRILDQTAHGIFRAYTTIAFGVQGPLTFGYGQGGGGAIDSYFEDSGVVVVFEDRNISDDKYFFKLEGHSTTITSFILSDSTISTAVQAVIVSAGPDIDVLDLSGISFVGLKRPIIFPDDSASYSHFLDGCSFIDCGYVYPGTVPIVGCTFSNAVSGLWVTQSDSASGYYPSLLWHSSIAITGSSFTDNVGPSSSAILHPNSGTYNYNDLIFNGNTYDIIFLGTGLLTINNLGSSNSSTYLAPNGGTVQINQAVKWTFTGIVSGSEVRIQEARGANPSGAELYHVETTDGGNVEWTFNFTDFGEGYKVDIIIHNVYYEYLAILNVDLPDANATLPIQQKLDRWYSNP